MKYLLILVGLILVGCDSIPIRNDIADKERNDVISSNKVSLKKCLGKNANKHLNLNLKITKNGPASNYGSPIALSDITVISPVVSQSEKECLFKILKVLKFRLVDFRMSHDQFDLRID